VFLFRKIDSAYAWIPLCLDTAYKNIPIRIFSAPGIRYENIPIRKIFRKWDSPMLAILCVGDGDRLECSCSAKVGPLARRWRADGGLLAPCWHPVGASKKHPKIARFASFFLTVPVPERIR
jgi:hypothetical protein